MKSRRNVRTRSDAGVLKRQLKIIHTKDKFQLVLEIESVKETLTYITWRILASYISCEASNEEEVRESSRKAQTRSDPGVFK